MVIVNSNGQNVTQSRIIMTVIVATIGYLIVFSIISPMIFNAQKKAHGT